jgi:predicted dehydrogenase
VSVGVGLYGTNGHQIDRQLAGNPRAHLVAASDDLDAMLADDRVQLVSLCSPRRADQAADAIRCLEAGRHVYAEKPCALIESDVDAIVAAARASGRLFHEMAGTAFEQPYLAMREVVAAGTIGPVAQVVAQKSYPMHERRPADEETDGGLIRWVGVHAVRFVEHVAGVTIVDIDAVQTKLGNGSGPYLSAVLTMALDGGGVAAAALNYLNPPGFGSWGNEHLRVFGPRGFVEAVDGGSRTRLVVGDVDHGPLPPAPPARDYFELYLDELLGVAPMPLSLAAELSPTRWVIRAEAVSRDLGMGAVRSRQPRS